MAVRRTILVVEDEKDIRELVRFHLEQEGYAVREAETGEAALAQIAKERPALLVLDLMLPSTDTYEVCLDGVRVGLSLREFELLKFFVRHPQRVYDRLQLLDLVWGPDTHVEPRTVDVHIRRLRKRIERNDAAPELIVTVRGVGYKFNPDALDA